MPTTFTSRELIRDELASKFVSNGSWNAVYQYHPSIEEVLNTHPFLVIRSAGTQVEMMNEWTNKRTFRFAIISYVLAYSPIAADSWTSALAEDKLDNLDMVICQVIRNNAGSMTTCDDLLLDNGLSQPQDVILEGVPYIRESRFVSAYLQAGA